jgi:hypothetical protein
VGKPEGKRPLGRLGRRWEDNINVATCLSDFIRGFELANRFIGYSPGGNTINFNAFNLTVTITLRNYEQ